MTTTAEFAQILTFLSGIIYNVFTVLDSHYIGSFSILDYFLSLEYVYLTYSFIFAAFGQKGASDESNNA